MRIANIEKRNGIAIIWLDQEGEKINKVSVEFMDEVDRLFKEVEADAEIKAAVLISKKKILLPGRILKCLNAYRKRAILNL